MPTFSYTPRMFSDASALPEGLHPAFLVAVTDEETPEGWQMREKSPRMWRWYFAVYDNVQVIPHVRPELQSTVSSQTFSPGGKYQPSKAYVWAVALLNRQIGKGEKIDIDAMLPLACELYISRRDKQGTPVEQAIIKDLVAWGDGAQYLTPELKARLAAWWHEKSNELGTEGSDGQTAPPPPAAPTAPAAAQPIPMAAAPKGW